MESATCSRATRCTQPFILDAARVRRFLIWTRLRVPPRSSQRSFLQRRDACRFVLRHKLHGFLTARTLPKCQPPFIRRAAVYKKRHFLLISRRLIRLSDTVFSLNFAISSRILFRFRGLTGILLWEALSACPPTPVRITEASSCIQRRPHRVAVIAVAQRRLRRQLHRKHWRPTT